jgi:hypothetical protein
MGEMRNTLKNFGWQILGNIGIGGKVILKWFLER